MPAGHNDFLSKNYRTIKVLIDFNNPNRSFKMAQSLTNWFFEKRPFDAEPGAREEDFLVVPSFEPGAAEWEASTLPLCYATPIENQTFAPPDRNSNAFFLLFYKLNTSSHCYESFLGPVFTSLLMQGYF